MKEQYILLINEQMQQLETDDVGLLDFISQLLAKRIDEAA